MTWNAQYYKLNVIFTPILKNNAYLQKFSLHLSVREAIRECPEKMLITKRKPPEYIAENAHYTHWHLEKGLKYNY